MNLTRYNSPMAKRKPDIQLDSYGLYTPFDRDSDKLPKVRKHTLKIPAQLDIEFGYVLRLRKAKNALIRFEIDHPPFPGEDGKPSPPFTGELYVRNNDFRFFLGDTLWDPVENKIGPWVLTTWLDDEEIMQKTFDISFEHREDGGPQFLQL